jgi:2-polyprenyl-3-methyl-5-hydroxy-6-metoxy-1,4-benzoquinol methylase
LSVKFGKYAESGAYHWRECDRHSPGWTYNPPLVARYRMVLDQVSGGTVLDIGGGDGYIAGQIAPLCRKVVVVDNEDAGVALAQEILRSFENVQVIKDDAYDLSFRDEEFDTVLMTDVIEHLDRPERAAAEAARVMAPGGAVLITTPQWSPDRPIDFHHVKEYRPEELTALLDDHFEHVEMRYGIPKMWADLYNTKIGWRALKLAGRAGFNPFLATSDDPSRHCHMLAICRGRRHR